MENPVKPVDLAAKIDHTVLGWEVTLSDVQKACEEAKEYHFHSVYIPPYFVQDAVSLLEDTEVKVGTVTGFPYGFDYTSTKVEQTKRAIEQGVDEIDMVMNISALKSGHDKHVVNDMQSLSTLCRVNNKVLKVIIETNLLSKQEIIKACTLCIETEPAYVKTCTGYSGGGATIEVVQTIRDQLPKTIKVKAAGGIRTKSAAMQLIDAGADRIGTSTGIQIVQK